MDFLLVAVIRYPLLFRFAGWLCFVAGSIPCLLGLALGRRLARVERRTGLELHLENLVAAIPFPVATSLGEYVIYGGLALCGVAVNLSVKSLQRQVG